jgi:putative hydrolase of the HAD superfamily
MKAIIFDWGGVCCSGGEPFASTSLQESLGLTPDEITKKAGSIYKGYYTGEYDRDDFWAEIIQHFGLEENKEINPATLSNAYLDSYEVYQDVLELILELKKKFKIGLLSNLTPAMRDYIRKTHQLEKYFDVQVYSCDPDVRFRKPSREAFQIILDRIGLPAEECLFVDDLSKNIEAAADMGMKTILFESREQFFADINKFVS